MKRTKSLLIILVVLTIAVIPTGIFSFIRGEPTVVPTVIEDDYIAVDWRSGLAGDIAMPEISEEFSGDPLQIPSGAQASSGLQTSGLQTSGLQTSGLQTSGLQTSSAEVGDEVFDWYLDVATNDPYMTLRAKIGKAEIWVANDLMFEPGDPRNDAFNMTITDEMVNYIADEFNNVIYPTNTEFFGLSNDRDGNNTIFEWLGWDPKYYNWSDTDDPQRVIIKVFNIRDDNYYDPTYPYYIAGSFPSTYNSYWNRNMMHIDSWRWWQRIGDEGDTWLDDPPYNRPDLEVTRPHVYESTIAHEYQHLIHGDWQPASELWMNEGCSMYAELLCGYGIEDAYFNAYFATPDNSLTIWGDQGDINILADYGAGALWVTYLSDHYGGADLIREYVQSGIAGIEGINAVLAEFGYDEDFYDVYHDWRLANLIRSDYPGKGKYNYESIDVASMDPVRLYEISDLPVPLIRGIDFGSTITTLGYDTGVSMVGAFGSDYIEFSNWRKPGRIYFNGDDEAYLGWQPIPDGFWSAFGDEQDKWLVGEAYVDPGNPVLELITKYNIEPYWDFGFIQAWNESSGEWVSLENAHTTYLHDPGAYDNIIEELPGLTGTSPGWPDVWTTMTFDLTEWAGQDVMFNFRYMTDWAITEDGWYINQASVSGNAMSLSYESGEADFLVTAVQVIETRKHTIYIPYDLNLDDVTEEGSTLGIAYKNLRVILVVSTTMEAGFTDYSFEAQRFKFWKWF